MIDVPASAGLQDPAYRFAFYFFSALKSFVNGFN